MFSSIKLYLKGRPLLANCITYGGLYMGAEFSQQTLLRKVLVSQKPKFDQLFGATLLFLHNPIYYDLIDGRLSFTCSQKKNKIMIWQW